MKQESWEYLPHHKKYASGSIYANGFLVANLTPAAACSQNKLDINGRLISAAPDLLEAAKETLAQLEEWAETRQPDNGPEWAHIKGLRAAIAKAEGK